MTFFNTKRLISLDKIRINVQRKKKFNKKMKNFVKFQR